MKRKELRVEKFLGEMDRVIPWSSLVREIVPYYKGEKGRPPHDLELMLRIHFLQLWHNLSDPGMEEALYDRLGSSSKSVSQAFMKMVWYPVCSS
jgi:IS5 family transposase